MSKKVQTGKIVEETLSVQRPSGLMLQGQLTYRDDLTRQGPVVVYVHGTMSTYDHNFTTELARKLVAEHGIRSYRYNSRFHSTEFEPEHRYKFSGFEDDIDDMSHVISSLKSEGFDIIGLLGHSRGANDVLMYASSYCESSMAELDVSFCGPSLKISEAVEDVNDSSFAGPTSESVQFTRHLLDPDRLAVIAISPRFDMTKMLSALFSKEKIAHLETEDQFAWESQRGDLTVTREDAEVTNSKVNMKEIVERIPAQVPVLLLHGTEDELIDVADAYSYKAARSSIDLMIVEGARHAYRGKKQNKILIKTICEWISKIQTIISVKE